jgi:hypothetical protein
VRRNQIEDVHLSAFSVCFALSFDPVSQTELNLSRDATIWNATPFKRLNGCGAARASPEVDDFAATIAQYLTWEGAKRTPCIHRANLVSSFFQIYHNVIGSPRQDRFSRLVVGVALDVGHMGRHIDEITGTRFH